MNNRRGMKIVRLDLNVLIDKALVGDPAGIYTCLYKFNVGRDEELFEIQSVYCHFSHDLSIQMCLRKLGLLGKRIKKIQIIKLD
jgi:hypothetical protein